MAHYKKMNRSQVAKRIHMAVKAGVSVTAISLMLRRYEKIVIQKHKKQQRPIGLIARDYCLAKEITIEQLKYPPGDPHKRQVKQGSIMYVTRGGFCREAFEQGHNFNDIAKFLGCTAQTPRNYINRPKY